MLKKGILILVLIIAIIFTYLYNSYTAVYDIGEMKISILIKQGDSFNKVANQIIEKKLLDSKLLLKLMARFNRIDKKLTPGKYEFTGEYSCATIFKKLEKAEFVRVKFTIPEGLTLWQTASLLSNRFGFDSTKIIKLNTDSVYLAKNKIPSLEGYLYPETYFIPWGSSLDNVLAEVINMFFAETDSIWIDSFPNNMSREEIMIMASIVESETSLAGEYAKVSSVYHNRIRKNMRLDADPTVIYGLGGLDRPLRLKDLKKDTPYNTYLHKGLPPTPINSPSLMSIKAAIYPEKTDFLFFVADNSGGHYFSKTNAEHNLAKERIKRESK